MVPQDDPTRAAARRTPATRRAAGHRPQRPRWAALVALLAALAALGCGNAKTASTGQPTPTPDTTAPADDTLAVAEDTSAGDDDTAPSGAEDATAAADTSAPTGPCPAYVAPVQVGALDDDRLDELSGLVASRNHDDVLWSHNDSGEKHARLFALDGTGALRLVLRLGSLKPVDTEDVAIGPCAGAQGATPAGCLLLGDVGDNNHERAEAQAYRVAEPASIPAPGSGAELHLDDAAVDILRWTYPARPELKRKARAEAEHPDIEAMVVLADGRIVLLDKRDDGVTNLFRVQPSTTPTVAEAIGTLGLADGALVSGPSLRVTAADLSDDGTQLLVRCYFRAYQVDVAGLLTGDAASAIEALPNRPKHKLVTGFDVQGEAMAWARQGGYWHASEGASAPVFFVGCAPAN